MRTLCCTVWFFTRRFPFANWLTALMQYCKCWEQVWNTLKGLRVPWCYMSKYFCLHPTARGGAFLPWWALDRERWRGAMSFRLILQHAAVKSPNMFQLQIILKPSFLWVTVEMYLIIMHAHSQPQSGVQKKSNICSFPAVFSFDF